VVFFILVSFFRTMILYVIVIIVMRLMGKRQIGELQPYELVVAIMISDLASIPMQNTGVPLLSGVIPILTILMVQILISLILFKSNRARKIISGTPVSLIKDGIIVEKNLNREIFTLSDLLEAVRIGGYSDLSQVREAILETNGELSIYGYDTEPIPLNIILDGKLAKDNLEPVGITVEEVKKRISQEGAKDISQILLCCVSKDKWFIQLKGEKVRGLKNVDSE